MRGATHVGSAWIGQTCTHSGSTTSREELGGRVQLRIQSLVGSGFVGVMVGMRKVELVKGLGYIGEPSFAGV